MKNLIVLFVISSFSFAAQAEDSFQGYSLEEATAFRNEWNLDNWDEGGPLMRYVFMNMAEFWGS